MTKVSALNTKVKTKVTLFAHVAAASLRHRFYVRWTKSKIYFLNFVQFQMQMGKVM